MKAKILFLILTLVLLFAGLMVAPVALASALPPIAPASVIPASFMPPLASSTTVTPTEASSVTVESARPLPEAVDEPDAWFASLSPDGAYLAYFTEEGRGRDRTGQICVFTFSNAGKSCYDLSRDLFSGYPYNLSWSPDSSMI